jgi:putative FmdB family regulatory protein
MPTYAYFCEACNQQFDAFQKFSDAPLTVCPHGHPSVRRVFTPAGIIFKGSGWYSTDSKSTTSTASSNGATSASSESKADSSTTKESAPSKSSSAEAKSEAA